MANTFKNYPSAAVGTSAATIVTASAATTVIGLTVANITASTINVDVYTTIGGTNYYIVKGRGDTKRRCASTDWRGSETGTGIR